MKEKLSTEILEVDKLEEELVREKKRMSKKSLFIGILCALPVIFAIVIIITNFFPVYQVHGSSMKPLLTAGDTVVCIKGNNYEVGDVVAIEYDDKILIKRIVAGGKDWVNFDEEGNLFVNGEIKEEAYVINNENDIKAIPVQVPNDEWYVLGDNRAVSGDSRLNEIGTVDDGKIIGKVIFKIWPMKEFGAIN